MTPLERLKDKIKQKKEAKRLQQLQQEQVEPPVPETEEFLVRKEPVPARPVTEVKQAEVNDPLGRFHEAAASDLQKVSRVRSQFISEMKTDIQAKDADNRRIHRLRIEMKKKQHKKEKGHHEKGVSNRGAAEDEIQEVRLAGSAGSGSDFGNEVRGDHDYHDVESDV
jgi:hypothetical protein